jgi:hypothetical protein
MAARSSRRILWTLTLCLSAFAGGTAGQQAPSDGPVQMTREEDHARTMKELGIATLPRGAAANDASRSAYAEERPAGDNGGDVAHSSRGDPRGLRA